MKLFKDFENMQTYEKACTILGLILSLAGMVFAVLAIFQNLEILHFSVEMLPVALLLLGIQNLLNTVKEWKKDRKSAVFYLATGVFVISCVAVVLCLRAVS